MKLKVYVAAPYSEAENVRLIHNRLLGIDCTYTSFWAERAWGPEDFSKFTESQLRKIGEENDTHIRIAHLVLALPLPGMGGEMFAEIRYAQTLRYRVFWVGERKTLSSFRAGVTRFPHVEDALEELKALGRVVQASGKVPVQP